MKFEQVCQSLNAYFAQSPIFKVLLPLGTPILLVCAVLQDAAYFINLGSVMNVLTYLGFFLGLLLVLSLCNFRMVSIGLVIYAAGYVYSIIRSLIRYRSVSYSGILYLVFFGFLAYQAYRKSLLINK